MQRLLIGISLLSFISIFPLLSSEAGIDVQEIEYEVINETGLDDVSLDAYAKIEDFLSRESGFFVPRESGVRRRALRSARVGVPAVDAQVAARLGRRP